MTLYVVLRGPEGGRAAVAVFSRRGTAQTFIDERGLRDARVVESTVGGDYDFPEPVFVAHQLREETGAQDFLGLFASEVTALSRAGDAGTVRTMRPDSKSVENIH